MIYADKISVSRLKQIIAKTKNGKNERETEHINNVNIQNILTSLPYGNTVNNRNVQKTVSSSYSLLVRTGLSPEPIKSGLSANDYKNMVDFEKYRFLLDGVNKNDICTVIYFPLENIIPMSEAVRKIGAQFIPLEGHLEEIFNNIIRLNITVIYSKPDIISQFILYVKKHQIKPNIRLILTGGQKIDKYDKFLKEIYEYLGAELIDHVGTSELLNFAIHCKTHGYYHFIDKHQIVEIIDPKTNQPSNKGEIIVTPLWREDYCLFRYKTGDYVEIKTTKPCGCKIQDPRVFTSIIKRIDTRIKINGIMGSPEHLCKSVKGILTNQFGIIDRILWKLYKPPVFMICINKIHNVDNVIIIIQKNKFKLSFRHTKPLINFFQSNYYLRPTILLIDSKLEEGLLPNVCVDLRNIDNTDLPEKIEDMFREGSRINDAIT